MADRPGFAAVLFDHDGTLVDSIDLVVAATNAVLAAEGVAPADRDAVIAGMVLPTAPRLGRHCGVEDPAVRDRLARDFYAAARERGAAEARCYPAIEEVLRALHGRLPLAVVSNNEGRLIRRLARELGIAAYLDPVLGEEDVPAPKPRPDGLLAACGRLGVDPGRCAYVGDGAADRAAARAAGMTAIGVTWGTHRRDELAPLGFDHLVDDAEALLAVLTASSPAAGSGSTPRG